MSARPRPTRAELAADAGFMAIHARESVYQGAFATHGPTLALVSLYRCYLAAWPHSADMAMARDRLEVAAAAERRWRP